MDAGVLAVGRSGVPGCLWASWSLCDVGLQSAGVFLRFGVDEARQTRWDLRVVAATRPVPAESCAGAGSQQCEGQSSIPALAAV